VGELYLFIHCKHTRFTRRGEGKSVQFSSMQLSSFGVIWRRLKAEESSTPTTLRKELHNELAFSLRLIIKLLLLRRPACMRALDVCKSSKLTHVSISARPDTAHPSSNIATGLWCSFEGQVEPFRAVSCTMIRTHKGAVPADNCVVLDLLCF